MLWYSKRFVRAGILAILWLMIGTGAPPAAVAEVNLVFTPAPGWSCPVVPNDYDTSTQTSCLLPPVLWTQNIYWNAHGENLGPDPTPSGFDVTYYVDGQVRAMAYSPAVTDDFWVLNEGPGDYLDRGLHTVHAYVDALGGVTETDETDNAWGRQYWGSGMTLPVDHTGWLSAAPPDPEGGWDYVSEGGPPQENCHGYYAFTGDAQAVVAAPTEATDDYELRLHEGINSAPTDVPAPACVTSDRGPGSLEAVFVFGHTGDEYTATVVNRNAGEGDYITFREAESDLDLGVTDFFYFLPDHLLRLLRYSVPAGSQGWIRATVETEPGTELHVATLDPAGPGYLNLEDAAATATTNEDGVAVLSWQVFDSADHYVVVYREGVDLPESGVGFEITVDHPEAVADLAPAGEDWWSPFVPSATHQASGPVGAPVQLEGNAAATYYNFQFRNAGYAATGSFTDRTYLDGVSDVPILYLGGLAAQSAGTYLGSNAKTVRGGRHTLAVVYDTGDGVTESDETNNSYAEQYCWTPLELTYGATTRRAAPPAPLAGTEHVPAGVTVYPNCDGLRLPEVGLMPIRNGWWRAAAAMPVSAKDQVNLYLHEASAGPLDGFGEWTMCSSAGVGQQAYVVVNYHVSENVDWDVGLRQGLGGCSGDVSVEAPSSLWVNAGDGGSFGPWTLAADQCLDLLDLPLDAGSYSLQVDNLSGAGTLVATLHLPEAAFASCTAGIVPGGVDAAEEGGPAYFTVDLPEAGFYGLAIWKLNSADLDRSISYRLRIQPGASAVDGIPAVTQTGLVGAYPNPFNPRTRIVFDIERTQRVELSLYDLAGRHVRTLRSGSCDPGRHEAVWDGLDQRGGALGSGVYLARLRTEQGDSLHRLTLVR